MAARVAAGTARPRRVTGGLGSSFLVLLAGLLLAVFAAWRAWVEGWVDGAASRLVLLGTGAVLLVVLGVVLLRKAAEPE